MGVELLQKADLDWGFCKGGSVKFFKNSLWFIIPATTSTPALRRPPLRQPPLRRDLHSDDLDDQLHVSVSLQDLSRCRCVPPRPLLSLSLTLLSSGDDFRYPFDRNKLEVSQQQGNIGGQLQIFICIAEAHHIGAARQHIRLILF
ncbi:hypothetical protein LXL04_026175 [Taraxacum kok-saghyz]